MSTLINLADLKGPKGDPGEPGQDATDAAGDVAALTAFVNGSNTFRSALDTLYAHSSGENLLAYAENKTGQGTVATITGNWAAIVGLQIHIPPTTKDVLLLWSGTIGTSVPGQGNIYTAPWDITGANVPSVFVASSSASSRVRSNDIASNVFDVHHGFAMIGSSTLDRIINLCAKTGQEGSSLAGYVKNGTAGFDHSWLMAVTL